MPVLATMVIGGCGGGPAPKSEQTTQTASKPAAKPDRVPGAEHGDKLPAKKQGIPMDAYFDNPLQIAANNTALAPAAPAKEQGGAAPEKAMNDGPKPPAGDGALVWSEFLPAENLQSETKKIQSRVKGWLQGPGTYNGNYKEIAVDGAVIAALAGIAIEHSGEISWKKNAPLIRDLGHELSQAATGLGKENYEKSKTAFDKLDSVFGGAIPADAPKAAPKRPFNETADRGEVMKRIDKARNHLRDNINTEAKLKAGTDDILHETMMISTLGKVVTTDGYSSADEKDYQNFAAALINGAKDASTAAKDQNFQKFSDAMNKVNKSCAECHANYGNG